MPDRPANSVVVGLTRAGTAEAPLEIRLRVNAPVESGVPVRLETPEGVLELAAGADIATRRETIGAKEVLTGYFVTQSRTSEMLARLLRASSARLIVPVAGETQSLKLELGGLEEALRYVDERQGRTGARDALIDKGERAPASAPVPARLPAQEAWPRNLRNIFDREGCEERLATFDELQEGFVASPASGEDIWVLPCSGGNYNIGFIAVRRVGDKGKDIGARLIGFPSRLGKRRLSVIINPVWWEARREMWSFERGRAAGDCGIVRRYAWSGTAFRLADERRKEDCDGNFADPWTAWTQTRRGTKPAKGR
jgi:hypothetical protein